MGNPFKQRVLAHELVHGCWLSLASSMAAEALAHVGFDFLVVDTEHSPADTMSVVSMLQAIGNAAVAPVVRVAGGDPVLVKRAMDAGANTVVFPAIGTEAQARHAVAATRFPQPGAAVGQPGLRGVAGLVRAARYGADPTYLSRANDDACVIVQIETAEGLAHCDAIAAVPGVDCLFVGPADLAASLGHLGDSAHPRVQTAITTIAQTALAHGKSAGIYATSAIEARAYTARGFSVIALAADTTWLVTAARDVLAAARNH